MPVFLLVASITRTSVSNAQLQTMAFLEQWGGIAPEALKKWIRTTIGCSVGYGFLVALAFSFCSLGDGKTMFVISKPFNYFGYQHTEWSAIYNSEFEDFQTGFRIRWGEKHRAENLVDPKKWEQWKVEHGKNLARIPRTLIWFSALLLVAGLYDATSRTYWRRGILLVILGGLSFVGCVYNWADRNDHFVREVLKANLTLNESGQPIPNSLSMMLGHSTLSNQ